MDSGHLCLSGNNEVIILPRLDSEKTAEALKILRGDTDYDLLMEPHSDAKYYEKPPWPSVETLMKLKQVGISYSFLVLGPGEFLHINKGRLHMFRKASVEPYSIEHNLHYLHDICVSVAWDWLYEGYSTSGVAREMAQALSAAQFNRDGSAGRTVASLGIPATAITAATKALVAKSTSIANAHYSLNISPNATTWGTLGRKSRLVPTLLRASKIIICKEVTASISPSAFRAHCESPTSRL